MLHLQGAAYPILTYEVDYNTTTFLSVG